MKISVWDMLIRTGGIIVACGFIVLFTKDALSGTLGGLAIFLLCGGALMMDYGLNKIKEKK